MKNQRPHYRSLDVIALVLAVLLIEEIRLPFSPTADGWLIGLWVLLFYGALVAWLRVNHSALQSEPWPFDSQQSASVSHAPEVDEIDEAPNYRTPDVQAYSFHASEAS